MNRRGIPSTEAAKWVAGGLVIAAIIIGGAIIYSSRSQSPGHSGTDTSYPSVSLEQLALRPELFDVGERVSVQGFLFQAAGGQPWICDQVNRSPARIRGACLAATGITVADIPGAEVKEGTAWFERPLDVHAVVAQWMPGPSHPERAVLFIETIPSNKEDDQ